MSTQINGTMRMLWNLSSVSVCNNRSLITCLFYIVYIVSYGQHDLICHQPLFN